MRAGKKRKRKASWGEPPISAPTLMRTDKDPTVWKSIGQADVLEVWWTGALRVDQTPMCTTSVCSCCRLSLCIPHAGGALRPQPLTEAPGDKVG